MAKDKFSKKIINWYLQNHRNLPWREKRDPYQVWLSEVILQQTRVAQGLPYYVRFIRDFPNVNALAATSQQKVLRAWQGLGYYSRARHLHACAKVVVASHKGKFPKTYDALLSLPGVGSYTAAAIASIAFDQPVAVVDGNVYRVLSRVFGISEDIGSTEGKKIFKEKAQELLDVNQPGIYNQAVMEFGALHCTPKLPKCERCIFSRRCIAKRSEMQSLLPVKNKKVKVRNRYFTYFIFSNGKKLALRKRNGKDIWSGLYDFYLFENNRSRKPKAIMDSDALFKRFSWDDHLMLESKQFIHVLTHQRIHARFVQLTMPKGFWNKKLLEQTGLKLYSVREVGTLPKPTLISKFLAQNGILE